MANYFTMNAAFANGVNKVKDLASLRAHIAGTMPDFGMSLSWPANPNTSLGYLNGFVSAPVGSGLKDVFVIGTSEADFVTKMAASIPRLLGELAQKELVVVSAGVEYVAPDRKALARAAAKAAAEAEALAKGEPLPQPKRGVRRVQLQAA